MDLLYLLTELDRELVTHWPGCSLSLAKSHTKTGLINWPCLPNTHNLKRPWHGVHFCNATVSIWWLQANLKTKNRALIFVTIFPFKNVSCRVYWLYGHGRIQRLDIWILLWFLTNYITPLSCCLCCSGTQRYTFKSLYINIYSGSKNMRIQCV